ncbi:MAG: kelch repeat-containing protein [Candidatus Limnocylindrales bacterium]
MRSRLGFSGALVVVALLATGCGSTSPTASGAPPTVAPTPVSSPSAPSPTATPATTATPVPTPTPSPASWVSAGSLNASRGSTRLVALTDGRALVVGDDNFCDPGPAWDTSMAAEVWEAGKWATTGSLNSARNDFTAQPLANGQAFVVGGTNVDWISFSSPKIWDPKTGTWNTSGLMATARSYPASALLKDGMVIVIAGEYRNPPADAFLATAEVFNPATGKFAKTGALKVARSGAMAVTLADGRVLAVGGYTAKGAVADSEIWDPTTGKWAAVGATPIWGGSVLVPLADGGALLAGGQDKALKGIATAYRLDPKTNKWAATGKMLTAAYDRAAAVLTNGQVLVAGGLPDHLKPATAAAELFDPATGTWTATLPMPSAREQSRAVLLQDGSILVAGGDAGYFPPALTPWCPKEIKDTLRYIPAVP